MHLNKECALAHSRAERGRLRYVTYPRECAFCAKRFYVIGTLQSNFLLHKKDTPVRGILMKVQ